jgi:hypothetical protein
MVTNKTGWVTQADCIEGFEQLSESSKAYSLSKMVWIDPKYELVRESNRKAGISYIVDSKFRFYHPKDAWKFEPVRDRAYCSYADFFETLTSGQVWESGDVSVWMENKGREV